MFSFLTTAYRTEDTLARTVRSVLAQTRGDWELIVVDNGMSDAIVASVQPYLRDPRVQLVRQENRGATGGVMAAAEVATGRYLVVLHSDDAVVETYCSRMAEFLEADPTIAVLCCDAHLFADPGMRLQPERYLRNAGQRPWSGAIRRIMLADLLDGACPYYSAAVRRDVWSALNGLTTDALLSDFDLWLRVLVAGYGMWEIPDALGYYRMAAGSLSRPTDPAELEILEAQKERALIRAAQASGDPDDLAALARGVRRLRYEQAVRRSRLAFQAGATDVSRRFARQAFATRRSMRAAAILLVLHVSPGVARVIYPVKQRFQRMWRTSLSSHSEGDD
jgi:GT2 family glycosyltransferase